MKALGTLNWVIGLAGLLIVCFTFYLSRRDPTPPTYNSFCVDEQGRLYSLGGHHKPDPKGVLQECTTGGWAAASATACDEANAASPTASQAALSE
ncbi:MAG TPA: hypothetical protein VJN93_03525 [Candidatus Acidoferrum sp.]|nr:hypothetical protein [Candidatus Acidoferrum sp.]